MALLTSNNVKKLIASPVTSGDTTITLVDVIGLPDVSGVADYTIITLIRVLDGLYEIVRVDDITGNVLTVQRAQEGTAALAYATSDEVRNFFTSGMFQGLATSSNNALAEAKVLTGSFNYDDTLTDADPTGGNIRFNNATLASITEAYVDYEDNSGINKEGLFNNIQVGSTLYIEEAGVVGNSALFTVDLVTDDTGYFQLDLTLVSSVGSLPANGEPIVIMSIPGSAGGGGGGGGGILPATNKLIDDGDSPYTILAADVDDNERLVIDPTSVAEVELIIDPALFTDLTVKLSLINKSDYRGILTVADTGTDTINDTSINKYFWKGEGSLTLQGDTSTNLDVIAGG